MIVIKDGEAFYENEVEVNNGKPENFKIVESYK